MKKQILYMLCATALLSSCHIYKSYDRPEDITTSGLYRDPVADNDTLVSDTTNFGNLPWREVFTDPQLQSLIEAGLNQNTDLLSAAQNVKAAQASLMSARLAYAPSLGLSPQGTISSFDKNAATKTYSLPVTASWQVDLFGQLLNSKRNAQVTLKQVKAYRQAVQTQVISNVANMYYTLLMLDRQLEITKETAEILKRNAETMEAMKDAAMYNINSAGVEQSKAAYAQVLATIPDIEQSIRETENALSTFLGEAPHAIKRGVLEAQVLPTELSAGIPIQLLSNRPDVKAAEMSLASCYYDTNSARAAFYPQITLSGSAGWTNNSGAGIVNPGKLLASVVGSLTQPLFYRGQNIARLKAAKAQEEQAKLSFQQALLNAGSEVSNALSLYQKTSEKVESRKMQVESAQKASEDTKELFNLGTSTYLEVLSAQQSYLSAQLSQVSDCFDQMQAVVSLYQALGGGRLAYVDPEAKLGKNVTVLPFAYIEKNVEIGDDCIIMSYASILKGTKMGKGNKVHQNAVLGAEPQDFHFTGEESSLIIGDNNDIRENVVISRATFAGNATKIGNGNYLMDKVHLCHDVQINNNCVVGIGSTIAGECTLDDCVILSGNVTLHQYCHIGSWTLVQSGCRISKDVPPYVIMSGNPVAYHGVNAVVLSQHRNTSERILRHIANAYRLIYQGNFSVQDAVQKIIDQVPMSEEIENIVNFVKNSERGIVK